MKLYMLCIQELLAIILMGSQTYFMPINEVHWQSESNSSAKVFLRPTRLVALSNTGCRWTQARAFRLRLH